jgi:hypothetical protein
MNTGTKFNPPPLFTQKGGHHWLDDANCRNQTDPELFDLDNSSKERRLEAIRICNACPVIEDCHRQAVKNPPYRLIQAAKGWPGGFDPVVNRSTGNNVPRKVKES